MSEKEITIKLKKQDMWKYSTFVLAAILIVGAFIFFSGNKIIEDDGNNPSERVSVSMDDDAVLGSKDAPVTIIEFSDYQCPFCERFWSQTFPLIKSQYIDSGKVKFVYRDFPLSSIHPQAQKAAEAAECIRDVSGKDEVYFEMHDKLFENIESLSIENYKKWALEIGYDISECLDSSKFASEVQKDASDGNKVGVRGTPAFFVNGKMISGAQPFSVFQEAIESEL